MRDGTSFQSKSVIKPPCYDILITPNIEWDSAALNQSDVFFTMKEWIEETLAWILNHTSYSIAIRQHPREKSDFINYGYPNYLKTFIEEKYMGEGRITFYSADNEVNTYDLIKNSKIILPWTSNVAVDAAVLGKQSIVHTEAYYQYEPYVTRVHSKEEYYDEIVKSIDTGVADFPVDEAKYDYYYHCRICVPDESINSVPSVFNTFMKNDVNYITARPVLTDLLKSWLTNESFMLLNYKRQLNDEDIKNIIEE